jgi:hypothetical protein
VAVEVPEDLIGKAGFTLTQNNILLRKDEYKEDCWYLNHVYGQVVVQWNENADTKEIKISIDEDNYLLFKLTGQNKNRGRRVRFPTFGSYLMIVPDNWVRDERLSGPPPTTPEPVSVEAYKGHFFDLNKNSDKLIAFQDSGIKPLLVKPRAERFALIGKQLPDASEGIGPLFGLGPPRIRDLNLNCPSWSDIGTIIVGAEGRGKGKWRKQFRPEQDQEEQDLPSEVLERKGGWYFLRFYDMNDDLVESLDFRFLSALKDIKVHYCSLFPGSDGHSNVQIDFIHELNITVQPAKEDSARSLQLIKNDSERTSVIIPPNPSWDLTYWIVKASPSLKMRIEMLIERIWWGMSEEGEPPPQTWFDKPIPASYDFFRATSKKTIYFYLPKCGWTQNITVGFEKLRAKILPVKVNERMVHICLRDFGDAQEICSRTKQTFLNVWLERNETIDNGISICEVLPDVQIVAPEKQKIDEEIQPSQMCCSTCDHARRRYEIVWEDNILWCRRYHWERVLQDTFDEYYARFICGEWQGEYRDKEGNWQ